MSNSIPKNIADKVKKTAFKKADAYGYLTKGRVENGQFMDSLASDPEVGGVIEQYLEGPKIKTYIKDAILNRYSKDRNKATVLLRDPVKLINRIFKVNAHIDKKVKTAIVLVYTKKGGTNYIACAAGTWVKWESALKKALIAAASCEAYSQAPDKFKILIVLSSAIPIIESERILVERALCKFDVTLYICD